MRNYKCPIYQFLNICLNLIYSLNYVLYPLDKRLIISCSRVKYETSFYLA